MAEAIPIDAARKPLPDRRQALPNAANRRSGGSALVGSGQHSPASTWPLIASNSRLAVVTASGTAANMIRLTSALLSPSRSRVLLSQTADEMEIGDGLRIAHDVGGQRG